MSTDDRTTGETRYPYNEQLKDSRDPPFSRGDDGMAPAFHVKSASISKNVGNLGNLGNRVRKAAEFRHSEGAEPVTHSVGFVGNLGNRHGARARRVDFGAVNAAALRELPALLARWLPGGRVVGREYEARNPRRADRHPGSFKVSLRTGRWSDFATNERGGDPVSFAAYLFGSSQIDAARRLADMLKVP